MTNTKNSLLPTSFTGTALADILANGVAIIVIMTVISLMIRHEQEQKKLEQTKELSVLLSRDIANSLVMNALPTSPPARLHNYQTSPLDRNVTHATMPIIELHDRFARDYYTGQIYRKEDLLRQDNSFDRYLSTLSRQQISAMRVDVYSINQFYIVMSILKDHDHWPRHWHFLTVDQKGLRDGTGAAFSPFLKQQTEEIGAGQGGMEETLGQFSQSQRLEQSGGYSNSLPEDISIGSNLGNELAGTTGQTTSNALGPGSSNGQGQSQNDLGLPPTNSGTNASPGISGGPRQLEGWQQTNEQRTTSKLFRNATNPTGTYTISFDELSRASNIISLLRAYFELMSELQTKADQGLATHLHRFDFRKDLLARVPALESKKIEPEHFQTLDNLGYWLSVPMFYYDDTVTIKTKQSPSIQGQAIALQINEPLKIIEWLRHPDQPKLNDIERYMLVGLEINVHPERAARVRLEAGQDAILLMPPDFAKPDPRYRWRVITMISPEVNDFITGFVYGAINDSGRLVLPVDENGVDIKGLRVQSHFKKVAYLGESRPVIGYSIIALLFIVGIVYQYRRSR